MKKKEILKEQKRLKEERKQVENLFQDDKEIYKVFKIGLGVILFIGLAFVVINIFNGNWNILTKKNTEETEINEKMLIAGTLFNKEENEYLVLAYDMNDEKSNFYGVLTSNYNSSPNLYYLDLSSGFNNKFIGDKTVISNNLDELKFSHATLLLIKGDKIIKSYITEKEIVDYFVKK